jgi:hypothetical protein
MRLRTDVSIHLALHGRCWEGRVNDLLLVQEPRRDSDLRYAASIQLRCTRAATLTSAQSLLGSLNLREASTNVSVAVDRIFQRLEMHSKLLLSLCNVAVQVCTNMREFIARDKKECLGNWQRWASGFLQFAHCSP